MLSMTVMMGLQATHLHILNPSLPPHYRYTSKYNWSQNLIQPNTAYQTDQYTITTCNYGQIKKPSRTPLPPPIHPPRSRKKSTYTVLALQKKSGGK